MTTREGAPMDAILRVGAFPNALRGREVVKRCPFDSLVYAYWTPEQSVQVAVRVIAEVFTDDAKFYEIRLLRRGFGEYRDGGGIKGYATPSEIVLISNPKP